jgi:choline dehydrogenase-like flavoprotein
MDHLSGATAIGELNEFEDRYTAGRRPGGIYIPRYANITEHDTDFVRGFGFQGGAGRIGWAGDRAGVGADFKNANRTPGKWYVGITAFGEMLPRQENRMYLHPTRRDAWGQPIVVFDVSYSDNDRALMARAARDAKAMIEAAGGVNINASADRELNLAPPGKMIHEMGTARMGADPTQSVLNGWCQAHDVANLFVTDGACMTSSACQNPSLTYMALTARAANHAADLLSEAAL